MQCPLCRVELQMSERQGIEIDYCPQCRGIWLDRGELDKILERASQEAANAPRHEWIENAPQNPLRPTPAPQPMPPQSYPAQPQHGYGDYNDYQPQNGHYDKHNRQYDKHGYPRKKKKNFLEDLFDFD